MRGILGQDSTRQKCSCRPRMAEVTSSSLVRSTSFSSYLQVKIRGKAAEAEHSLWLCAATQPALRRERGSYTLHPHRPLSSRLPWARGSTPLGSNLLTRLCLFWLASEDEMGISLGYGKHFDSLKACCTEPPSVLPLGVGVSKLRIDQHVHTKQSGSLA